MLNVKTPQEVFSLIEKTFSPCLKKETVLLAKSLGRRISDPIYSKEYVPAFTRSAVDGYAVVAADTFGCSQAIPAILQITGHVNMGETGGETTSGCCKYIPTGGALPKGADAVVMQEFCEDYADGTIGICKPVAPGCDLIFPGDDLQPGQVIIPAGRRLNSADIGALAAAGITQLDVFCNLQVGIISTGDELIPETASPKNGQIRDVNSPMLAAFVQEAGAKAKCYGIITDNEQLLASAVETAVKECDMVLISGGSSVGIKDTTCRVLERQGQILCHGIAIKPGKPTILAKVQEKPVLALPGNPQAAFFTARLFAGALIARLYNCKLKHYSLPAVLKETVSANHGRAQYTGVFLQMCDNTLFAHPIRSKSGLITALAASDGYFCIPKDQEGASAGTTVLVHLYSLDQEA